MSKRNKLILVIAIAVIVVSLLFIIGSIIHQGNKAEKSILPESIMTSGIELNKLSSYTGVFVEDGSDEEVSNVLAATVKNNSGRALEYTELELIYGGEKYEFSVSALPAGATAKVLEMNRKECPAASDDIQLTLLNTTFFEDELSLCEDALEISGSKGNITVKNISGGDINSRIFVCYKNVTDDGYLGGIAYRVSIPDGLAAGENVMVNTNHYDPDTCKIVFVRYGE